MNISRRSFLKMAGLTTVAAAGAVMFSSCSVASVLQVELDPSVYEAMGATDEDAKKELDAQIEAFNKGLKLVPIPFVNKLSVEQIKNAFAKAAESVSDADVKDFLTNVEITNAEDGYVVSDDKFIGTITVKLAASKASKTAVATLAL